MVQLEGHPDSLKDGEDARKGLIQFSEHIQANKPHIPQLTDEERTKVVEKVKWLLENETRAAYYNANFWTLKNPPDYNQVVVPRTILRVWLERIKTYTDKPRIQKAGNAVNGRVVRDSKTMS